jgi:hypothetical protein
MQRMIARFQDLLLEEIWIMMSPRVGLRRTPSQQSQSAMSTDSHRDRDGKRVPRDNPLVI